MVHFELTRIVRALCMALILIVAAVQTYAANFDCRRPTSSVEEMICGDKTLSDLDEQLNAQYRQSLSLRYTSRATLVEEHRSWLASRNRCRSTRCVQIHYVNRLSELADRGRSLPEIASNLAVPIDAQQRDDQMCARLLSSLKRWNGVTVVTPLVTADRVDDPKLRQQFGKCDPREFIEHYAIEPRVWRQYDLDRLPAKERRNYGTGYEMRGGFRFYAVDVDKEQKNGDELILYGAGVVQLGSDANDRRIGLSTFEVINTSECTVLSSAQVSDVLNAPNTFVGILEFEDSFFVFDSKRYPFESLWAVTIQHPATAGTHFETVCSFVSEDN
jgi:uncharacterized protein